MSASSGPVGTAVVERPRAGVTMPPGEDDDGPAVAPNPAQDEGDGEPVADDDLLSDEAARRRRRGGGPAIGH
jgi:hypothetical protein